jgi:hypothetical protein
METDGLEAYSFEGQQVVLCMDELGNKRVMGKQSINHPRVFTGAVLSRLLLEEEYAFSLFNFFLIGVHLQVDGVYYSVPSMLRVLYYLRDG